MSSPTATGNQAAQHPIDDLRHCFKRDGPFATHHDDKFMFHHEGVLSLWHPEMHMFIRHFPPPLLDSVLGVCYIELCYVCVRCEESY